MEEKGQGKRPNWWKFGKLGRKKPGKGKAGGLVGFRRLSRKIAGGYLLIIVLVLSQRVLLPGITAIIASYEDVIDINYPYIVAEGS